MRPNYQNFLTRISYKFIVRDLEITRWKLTFDSDFYFHPWYRVECWRIQHSCTGREYCIVLYGRQRKVKNVNWKGRKKRSFDVHWHCIINLYKFSPYHCGFMLYSFPCIACGQLGTFANCKSMQGMLMRGGGSISEEWRQNYSLGCEYENRWMVNGGKPYGLRENIENELFNKILWNSEVGTRDWGKDQVHWHYERRAWIKN